MFLDGPTPRRVTDIDQLYPGLEVRWCAKLQRLSRRATKFYDPILAQFFSDHPTGLRRGIVMHITKKRGVLLWVTSYGDDDNEEYDDDAESGDGIYGRKHWVPLSRV